MNTIQPNFLGLQYKNYYNKNQTDNTAKIEVPVNKSKFEKVSVDNLHANYLVSFKGGMKYKQSDNNDMGMLCHQTAFFREPNTDEIVQNYILENFDDYKINIVSGACSTGEEVKSYAMMLDRIKDKLNIYGFDISAEVIEDAKSGYCQLIKAPDNPMSSDLNSENMLFLDNASNLSEYQRKCCDKFRQYYTPKGPEYSIPIFPNAKQQLKDLEASLNNPEELEKQKKEFEKQIQMLKKESPELCEYMPNINFEKSIEISKEVLKEQTKAYKIVRDFNTDMSRFENCSFTQGDIMNLDSIYEPNSVNVLLYRNALYHTLCIGNSMYRYMKEDAKDTMDVIAKQMNKVLKPQGLVVFGEEEYMQGINTNVIKEIMENNGFKQLQEGNEDNIWVKVKDIEI